jgi:hypothetical protein
MRNILIASYIATASAGSLPANLQKFVDLANSNPEAAVEEIKKSGIQALVPELVTQTYGAPIGSALPTVLGHGMGDSCFNPGFSSIVKAVAKRTGNYATCIPTGDDVNSDTTNGFLMDMDRSVDIFASKIRNDTKLANGFNCIGFSQGNSLCRGYIQKYNEPPVNAFISVHGTVMGVAAMPGCFKQEKSLGLVCKAVAEIVGDLAYTPLVQRHLFQADYFRHNVGPRATDYMAHSQLAGWNNENPKRVNETYKINFGKTNIFAMVKAAKDSMVYPNEGEHWGAMDDAPNGKTILSMRETKFYKDDLFGLRTADEAGKIFFEETPGNHLQFGLDDLNKWVDKYFIRNASSVLTNGPASLFDEFAAAIGRVYLTAAERAHRFAVFTENLEHIAKMKLLDPGATYSHISPFADFTVDEFSALNTLTPQFVDDNQLVRDELHDTSSLPDAFDWVEKGAVNTVKNQGMCGSCWAFSTVANIEGVNFVKMQKLVSLSEQQLVDCDKTGPDGDQGCNGGLPANAFKFMISSGMGLESEAKYPYTGTRGDKKCHAAKSDELVFISGWKQIASDESQMAAALVQYGPLSIGINAGPMQWYMGGIANPWSILCNPKSIDHGVAIVGFGSEPKQYWKIRNSWGASWGEKGYYRIVRGVNKCGLTSMPTTAVLGASASLLV